MSGPRCIVCNKPIAKKVTTTYFKLARPEPETFAGHTVPAAPAGTREQDYSSVTIYVDKFPANRAEAQRYVNGEIVSSSRRDKDSLYSVGVWDGESYADEFFHSDACARKQGYASARHGARFTWKT